jgi:hypothetical protein
LGLSCAYYRSYSFIIAKVNSSIRSLSHLNDVQINALSKQRRSIRVFVDLASCYQVLLLLFLFKHRHNGSDLSKPPLGSLLLTFLHDFLNLLNSDLTVAQRTLVYKLTFLAFEPFFDALCMKYMSANGYLSHLNAFFELIETYRTFCLLEVVYSLVIPFFLDESH